MSPITIPYFSSSMEFQDPSIILLPTIETFCSSNGFTPKIYIPFKELEELIKP